MFIINSASYGVIEAVSQQQFENYMYRILGPSNSYKEVCRWANEANFGDNFVNQEHRFEVQCRYSKDSILPAKVNKQESHKLTTNEIFETPNGNKYIYLGYGVMTEDGDTLDDIPTHNYLNYSYIEEYKLPVQFVSDTAQSLIIKTNEYHNTSRVFPYSVEPKKATKIVGKTNLSNIEIIQFGKHTYRVIKVREE